MLLRLLLLFVPVAILAHILNFNPALVFVLSFVAIIPLASLLGEATEVLAHYTGPKIGGLLNATLGTLTEIIILYALLRSGQIEVLKASIIGAILMSLLLAIGLALLFGGMKNGIQKFDAKSVGLAAATMMLAVVGLMIPTFFGLSRQFQTRTMSANDFQDVPTDELSVLVAMILFVLYLCVLFYQLRAPESAEIEPAITPETPTWSMRRASALLVGAALTIAVIGEILSGAVEPFGEALGLSPLFMGIVILPLAGGFSELLVSVRMARANQMNLGLAIPLNGAMQGALFVAPLLVFLSLFGTPLTLYFGVSEIVAVALAVFITAYIAIDGVTSWLEGAQLLALWGMLALWFYFIEPVF